MSDQNQEIQSCINLLREIADICEHASLTGSFHDGTRRTILRYNSTLTKLTELDAVKDGFFEVLPESATFGDVGVEARMLVSYVAGKDKSAKHKRKGGDGDSNLLIRLAPFVDAADLGMMVREHLKQGLTLDMDNLAQLAPFLDRETLGAMVREALSAEGKPATEEEEKTEPEVVPPPVASPPTVAKPTLEELLDRIRYPYLSTEERDQLLQQVREQTA
jgi:hypothetical protein